MPALNLRILTRRNHDKEPGVATAFLRWTFARAVFHRGYVLTSGIYFVVNARLSASQIIGLGTVMAFTLTLSDIPAGAWSDTFSRKWPLVAGHGFLAAGMVMTGLVTAYPLILCTQVLWALGWAFSGGADVAWLTDELGQLGQIARVLAARARWDLTGGGTGVIAFGLLGWAVGLPAAIMASGAAMALLGVFVAVRFPEDNFTPVRARRWAATLRVLERGVALARRDREILLVLVATMAVNGADMISWLFARRLVDLGRSARRPASPAGRPRRRSDRSASSTSRTCAAERHGISAHAGRNTARLALAAELPASVLVDLTGISIGTAERWSQWAKRDWTSLHRPESHRRPGRAVEGWLAGERQ